MTTGTLSNVFSAILCLTIAGIVGLVLLRGKAELPLTNREFSGPAGRAPTAEVETIVLKSASTFQFEQTFTGTVRAAETLDLECATPGKVQSVLVEPGEKVREDQVVIRMTGDRDLNSPVDGVVVENMLSDGAIVGAGTKALRIYNPENLEVWIDVPVQGIEGISAGDRMTVEISDSRRRLKVAGILPGKDGAGDTRSIFFQLPDAIAEQHRPGEIARLSMTSEREETGYWVPVEALMRKARGLWSVYRVEQAGDKLAKLELHFLEMLHREEQRAWMRGAENQGIRIVSGNVERLIPGQEVIVKQSEQQ